MTDERDPLDPIPELARLFGELEPDEVGGDLESEDALTREAVALLRDAWERVEPEPAQRRVTTQAPTLAFPLAVVLAAAAAVIAFASILQPTPRSGDDLVSTVAGLDVPDQDPDRADDRASDQLADQASAPPADASSPLQETPSRPAPEVDVVEDGRLVVRSGPVRLFLATRLPDERIPVAPLPETDR